MARERKNIARGCQICLTGIGIERDNEKKDKVYDVPADSDEFQTNNYLYQQTHEHMIWATETYNVRRSFFQPDTFAFVLFGWNSYNTRIHTNVHDPTIPFVHLSTLGIFFWTHICLEDNS